MFKVLLVVLSAIIIFERKTRKYLNPYKLTMIFGKKGSGKTTTLTKLALQHQKKGWKVYSTIDIPGCYIFDVEEIGKKTFPENSCILIDEVGMIWDNRDFKNFKPEVRDFFKFQRQYKLKVYLFSQTFDIDLKLRNLTDEMYLLTNQFRIFSVQRRILKRITISNASNNGSSVSSLVDEYKFDSILFGGLKFTFIPRYVYYFKSYDPKQLSYIEGKYYDMNDLQLKYLDSKNWIIDLIKIRFIKLVNLFKRFKPVAIILRRSGHSSAGADATEN